MSTFSTIQGMVEALYVGYFQRAGDPAGDQYWENQLSTGTSWLSAAASFSVQLEAQADYPFLATDGTSNVAAIQSFINSVYQDLFNRQADSAGLAYWTAQLQAAHTPQAIGEMILNIISGAPTGSADDLTLQNKVAVASFITNSARLLTWTPNLQAEAAALVAATTNASSGAGSVATEEAAWNAFLVPINQTFALTTGNDTNNSLGIPGAVAAGETVTGVISSTASQDTFNPGDNLTFNGGTLSLTDISHGATANELAGVVLTGPFQFVVQELNFAGGPFQGVFNFSTATGVTNATSLNSSSAVFFENMPTGAGVEASGAATTASHLDYTYATSTSAPTLTVDGGVNDFAFDNFNGNATSATINSTGAANGMAQWKGFYELGNSPIVFELTNFGDAGTISSLSVNATTNLVAELSADDFAATGASLVVAGAASMVELLSTTAGPLPFTSVNASGLLAGSLLMDADSLMKTFVGGGGGGNELLYGNAETNLSVAADFLSASATSISGGSGTGNILSAELVTGANASIFSNWQILDVTNLRNVTGVSAGLDAAIMSNDTVTGLQFSAADTAVDTVLDVAAAATLAVNGSDWASTNTLLSPSTSDTVQVDLGLTMTHTGGSGTLAITFTNEDTTGKDSLQVGSVPGNDGLVSTGDSSVTIASNGGGFANALTFIDETNNVLTSIKIAGADFFGLGLDLSSTGANIINGVITDYTNTTTNAPTDMIASSLTTIDASATTGGVFIAAGDSSADHGGDTITYTGLKILGGSGSDFIYNGAKSGSIVDGNGKGDIDALGSTGSSITFGTGAGDTAYVGVDPIGGKATFTATGPTLIANPTTAGTGVGETVTFGAGATGSVIVGSGAEESGTQATGTQSASVFTTVKGAATGLIVDFHLTGNTGNLTDNYLLTASDIDLAHTIADAVSNFGANTGVVYFTFGGNEYLISHLSGNNSTLGAGDSIVELVGVQNHLVSLASGVAHLG